jgi:serine/threonine-protein kinase
MLSGLQDDKRTKMGPTGQVRRATGAGNAGGTTTPPAAVIPAPTAPAPTAAPPANASTSYLPPETDPLLGQVLADRYLIQKKLGEGGMATVYLATHSLLEKQVALKILHGEYARKPELVERFMGEAKAASRIRHQNVIDISDFGTTPDGLVFFAMELLEGHELHEEIGRARVAGQLLPWDRSKRIFLQICAALGAAHALGIIHRDLKPENIYLVDHQGDPDFVKLLDFGIAKRTEVAEGDRKLTRTGMLFGTPEYMSPEQARGEAVDPRVDIYAMGCILFQLVTGRVPFEGENFMRVLTMHVTEPPPQIPPQIFDSIGAPRALAEVIDQALAKDRDQRFATVEELASAVRRVSGDKLSDPVIALASVPAPPMAGAMGRVNTQLTRTASVPEADPGPRPRSKLPMIVGTLILIGGAAGATAYLATGGADPASDHGGARGVPLGGLVTPGSGQPSVVPGPPTPAAPAAPTVPATAPATPTAPPGPPAAAPPVEPLTFKWARIRLNSSPPRAEVKDLTNGTLIGRTPFTFKVQPSHNARQFGLHRKGYIDAVVELIPDRQRIEHTERLVRGASTRKAEPATPRTEPTPPKTDPTPPKPDPTPPKPDPTPPKPDPTQQAGSPALKPDPAPTTPDPTPPKPEPVKPSKPPDDDCEPPCLKADPSRAGSAGSSAP